MRLLFASALTGMMLISTSPASANIQTDLNAGLPISTVIQNAVEDQETIDQILSEMLTNCKNIDGLITCKAGTADSIISSAADIFSADADALQSIGSAALEAGLTEEQITQIALNLGLDPTAILPATAAGNAQGQGQGLNIAPGQTGNAVTPPPFGSNAGGGGGGNASPSA